jgi:hypothetical protein
VNAGRESTNLIGRWKSSVADRLTIDVASPLGGWGAPWPNVAEMEAVLPHEKWTLVVQDDVNVVGRFVNRGHELVTQQDSAPLQACRINGGPRHQWSRYCRRTRSQPLAGEGKASPLFKPVHLTPGRWELLCQRHGKTGQLTARES